MAKIIGMTDVTAAELALIDGVASPGTVYASKALTVDANKDYTGVRNAVLTGNHTAAKLLTATSLGTPGALCVAEEHGDGIFHRTKLTLTAFAVGTGGDAEDLTIGALVYTFPAGAIAVRACSLKGIFDQASHGDITDGEVALGTVVGSGAEDTVETVGGEDLMVAQAIASVTLGTTVVTVAGEPTVVKVIASGASPRTVYLNLAATWPNIAAGEAVTFTGVITIDWAIIS